MYKRKSKGSSSANLLGMNSSGENSPMDTLTRTVSSPLRVQSQNSQSNVDNLLESSKSKRPKMEKPKVVKPFATTYFEDLTEKAGLALSEEDENHNMTCKPMTFLNNLKCTLENNVDFPRNVTEFVKGFKNRAQTPEQLKSFLIQNVTVISDDALENNTIQDSVMRLFLNVNCLQEGLVDYIMEKAVEFAIDDKPNLLQMVLKPLIFLDSSSVETKIIRGLLELLDIATHNTRLEIITCLPDIVARLEHESIALELSKYLNEDLELTPAVLDCLSYLSLPPDLRDRVQDQMLSILKTSAPPNFFPNLVNFFLMSSSSETNEMDLIRGLRDGLDWTVVGTQSVDISSSQVLTVIALRMAITKSKNLAANWLKVINLVRVEDDHKPLDIIMLLVLYSTSSSREKTVDQIFRKRIKASLFNCDLLDATFKKMKPVLREYLKEMLQIARSFLKSKTEPSVVDFGAHWFDLMFKELKDSQRNIIGELMIQEYSEDHDIITNSLNVLTKIATEDINALKPHSIQILTLVNALENLNTEELHQVMDLLCGLAFGVKNSFLQDDVQMLILKQLSSSNLMVKSRGVIGGIMAVKHLVCIGEHEDITPDDTSYTELSSLPDGPPKEAAKIIEMIAKSTSKFPEMISLFYDELALILSRCEHMDRKFLSWLSESITNDFQNNFIIDVNESLPKSIKGVPISVHFCLNISEEDGDQIALNIAQAVTGDGDETSDIKILPSLFRITRLIHTKQNDGDLSSIDALLGCGVLMPTIDPDIGLEEFDTESSIFVLDSYFHCINWFRELITAFCTQADTSLRQKVIERLNALVDLESRLARFIKNLNTEYKPPISSFAMSNSGKNKAIIVKEIKAKKPVKKSKAKKKKTEGDNDISILPNTLKSQLDTSDPPVQSSNVESGNNCKLNANLFRAIDFEALILFKEELSIDVQTDDSLSTPNSKFTLSVLNLLLDEISPKLSSVLSARKKKGFPGRPVVKIQNHLKPLEVISICLNVLPRLCYFMEIIGDDIQKSLDASEGVRDAIGMFTEKNALAQMCLGSLFNVLNIMFSWDGFRNNDNIANLKQGLRVLAGRRDPKNEKKSAIKELLNEASIYSLRYKDWCLIISTAVSLFQFFKTIVNLIEDKSLDKKLVHLSLDMLSVTWNDSFGIPEKGLHYNEHVNTLLSGYFTKPGIEMIKTLCMELKDQAPQLTQKNHVLNTFQCINKLNFPLLFRATCGALYEATKIELSKGLSDTQHLDLWKSVALSLKALTDILKTAENRSNLLTFLKKSTPIFRLFLSQGMPMMELKLRNETDSVLEILRMLQHSTRFLHSLHCHSRLKKDTVFVAYLPQMKQTLETLVYKVKAALTANKCSSAFWMGNLKNKNLQGELIPSQSSINTDSDNENDNDDDQLPADDDDSVSSEFDDSMDAGGKSVSNIF